MYVRKFDESKQRFDISRIIQTYLSNGAFEKTDLRIADFASSSRVLQLCRISGCKSLFFESPDYVTLCNYAYHALGPRSINNRNSAQTLVVHHI